MATERAPGLSQVVMMLGTEVTINPGGLTFERRDLIRKQIDAVMDPMMAAAYQDELGPSGDPKVRLIPPSLPSPKTT